MEVEFRRISETRCDVEVRRERFPDLIGMEAQYRPDEVPHDLVHFIAEAEWRLEHAIFGQFAMGGSSMFDPGAVSGKQGRELSRERRKAKALNQKLAAAGREEMEWSERLVGILTLEELRRTGASDTDPRMVELAEYVNRIRASSSPEQLESLQPEVIERACARITNAKSEWASIAVGKGITVVWPFREGSPKHLR